ncbi:hypothetical protein D3C79_715450 [compost metagenome]
MPFKLDQHGVLRAPAAHHPGQRGQQQVVDLGAVSRRGLLQQLPGELAVQPRMQAAGMAVLLAAGRIGARQVLRSIGQLALPPGQLARHGVTTGVLPQTLGPGLVGTGFRRQPHRLLRIQLRAGLLQVLEQHAPGHAVDDQVVDHQQQALAAVAHADQHSTQQRPFQAQAALRRFTQCQQRVLVGGLPLPEQVLGLARLTVTGLPLTLLAGKAQAQRIVLHQQGLQGRLDGRRLQGPSGTQQH